MSRLVKLLKPLARPVVKPVVQPFFNRLEARVQPVDSAAAAARAEVADVGARQAQTAADVEALLAQLPAILNAIATQNAGARRAARTEADLRDVFAEQTRLLGDQALQIAALEALGDQALQIAALEALGAERDRIAHDRLKQIEERGEFIRRELMYEIRYGGGNRSIEAIPSIPVDQNLLERRPLRVNLGCGHIPLEGYVNLDGRDLDGVDVVADVRALPFPAGSVDEFHAAHLFEHFPYEELRRTILPQVAQQLAPGGLLTVIVPDAAAMTQAVVAGEMSFDDFQRVTFGDQDYAGDFHFTMFDRERMIALLEEAGLVDAECVAAARPNGISLELEVRARAAGGSDMQPAAEDPRAAHGETATGR